MTATKPSHKLAVLFSSESDEWATPQSMFDALDAEFRFTLDPCSTVSNAKCILYFDRAANGLLKSWANAVVFMNPPYSEIESWMAKAHGSTRDGATVVCLVPSRTDTQWWHSFAMKHEIRFLKGRLKFGDCADPAPFPSAIIVMRPSGFKLESATIPS